MKTRSTTLNIKMIQTSLSKEFWEIKTYAENDLHIFIFLFIFSLFILGYKHKIYKYLQEELKGKSNFVQ